MKKVFAIFAIASVMVACNNSGDKKEGTVDSAMNQIDKLTDSATNAVNNTIDSAKGAMSNTIDSAKGAMDKMADSTMKKVEEAVKPK
jgi:phage-related protein